MFRAFLVFFLVSGVFLNMASVVAYAQRDTFKVNYFSNARTQGAPDATVRITNPGTAGAPSPAGDLCAMIYVFRPSQEMSECCGCKVTPNGLLTLSVNIHLNDNPLIDPRHGVIKIVSSVPTATAGPKGSSTDCDPTNAVPTPALRAWATHIQGPTPFSITETPFEDATLSAGEFATLKAECLFIVKFLGSGRGLCHCPPAA
jgi:hypothetical protein